MKYPFRVEIMQAENHVFWAASSLTLDGCVGQGETKEEAIRELEINEKEWLDTAKKHGTTEMTKFDDYLREQLQDPAFKKEYDALEPEFSAAQAIIDAGKKAD